MATKRISELSLRSNFDATCNVPVDDSTQSFRTTGQQIRDFIAPLTTIGDLLYATTAGAAARLGIGGAQQILRPVAGVPAWAYLHSVQRTATTTDSINATTDFIVLFNASGGAFTATLPTAASVTGKTYILKKIGTDLNQVTIATTSSQTIDGVTTTKLCTPNETLVVFSDGTNWLVLDRQIPSPWVQYTAVFTGLGTVTNNSIWSRRDKGDLLIRGSFTTGTGTAVAATMTLGYGGTSGNVSIDQSRISASKNQVVGRMIQGAGAAAYDWTWIAVPGTAGTVGLGFANNSTSGMVVQTGTASIINSTDYAVDYVRVPIDGWNI